MWGGVFSESCQRGLSLTGLRVLQGIVSLCSCLWVDCVASRMNRQTRNSREAVEDAAALPAVVDQTATTSGSVTNESTDRRGGTTPNNDQPSPQFLATVIAAVKSALRDERGASTVTMPLLEEHNATLPRSSALAGGESSTLLAQANSFLSSGAPPSFSQNSASAQDDQGR